MPPPQYHHLRLSICSAIAGLIRVLIHCDTVQVNLLVLRFGRI